VDLAARASTIHLPLVLALLAIPGVMFTWDLFAGAGFVTGVPCAIAAVATGVRRRRAVGPERTTSIAIGMAPWRFCSSPPASRSVATRPWATSAPPPAAPAPSPARTGRSRPPRP
jgi:hypothetical protein